MKNVSNASVTLHVCTLQRLSELWQVWQVPLRSIHSAVSLGVPWALCPTLAWHTQGLDSTSVHQMRHQHMIYTLYIYIYSRRIYIYIHIFYTYIYIWCRSILIWCRRYWEKQLATKMKESESWHILTQYFGNSRAKCCISRISPVTQQQWSVAFEGWCRDQSSKWGTATSSSQGTHVEFTEI